MEKAARRKRTRYELLADLLDSSMGGARKTTLMYRANLSFLLLNKYLSFLVDNGFLKNEGGFYSPSPKGLTYLHRFSRYQHAMKELTKSEQSVQSFMLVSGDSRESG